MRRSASAPNTVAPIPIETPRRVEEDAGGVA